LPRTRSADFQTVVVALYSNEEIVSFLYLDLLWGQGLYQKLRFVLVHHGDRFSILLSTDLSLGVTEIISLRVSLKDRMHVSGNEASDWCPRLPHLELGYAEVEPLSF